LFKIKAFVFLLIVLSLFFSNYTMAQAKPPYKVKEEILFIDDKEVYLAYTNENKFLPPKVVMAIHGSGRQASNYIPLDKKAVPFYVHQRDLALVNGYIFVVVSNGKDTWGTDKGLETLLNVHKNVQKRFNANKQFVLWATSAGGTLANRMVQEHPDKVSKVLGTFPVYNLSESFDRLPSAKAAWKSREFLKGKNPASHPSLLKVKPYLIYHGRSDKAVPYKDHSMRLYKEVNKLGGNVTLHIVTGGHSTGNWNVYNDKEISKFLTR
jgi:predicted esterase